MLYISVVCTFYCWVVFHCVHISHFVYWFLINGHLGHFQFEAIMNNPVTALVQVS